MPVLPVFYRKNPTVRYPQMLMIWIGDEGKVPVFSRKSIGLLTLPFPFTFSFSAPALLSALLVYPDFGSKLSLILSALMYSKTC